MFKKFMAFVLCIFITATLFAGCSNENSVEDQTTSKDQTESQDQTKSDAVDPASIKGKVTFLSHRTDKKEEFAKYVEEFQKIYPNIEVEIQANRKYKQIIELELSTNNPPSFFTCGSSLLTKEELAKYTLPVEDFMDMEKYDPATCFYWEGSDGKIHGLPDGTNAGGIVYNKKLFKEVGVEVPKTFDEFIEVGKKIKEYGKETGKGYIGLGTALMHNSMIFPWIYYVPLGFVDYETHGYNHNFRNDWLLSDRPFTEDEPSVKSILLFEKVIKSGMCEDDPISSDWDPLKKRFRNGEVGMIFSAEWLLGQVHGAALEKEDIGFFPFPYDNSGGPYRVLREVSLGYSCGNQGNIEANKAWYKWFMADNYQQYVNDTNVLLPVRKGITPPNIPAFEEFLSYDMVAITPEAEAEAVKKLSDRAQREVYPIMQGICLGQDVMEGFEKINNRWEDARNALKDELGLE